MGPKYVDCVANEIVKTHYSCVGDARVCAKSMNLCTLSF
jgi:hypothetical protein